MALKGNLEDIPLGNIFQMIFLEKKGGILSIKSGKKSISVMFDAGKILLAEQGDEIDEKRLKLALLNNKYITKDLWVNIKKECDRTLKPLWIALSGHVDKKILSFFIQRQVQHTIFTLLQWEKGEYTYNSDAKISLNKAIFKPIEGEFMIMEGYRIIDEWREIVKTLPEMDSKIKTAPDIKKTISNLGYQPTNGEKRILSLAFGTISIKDLLDSILADRCEVAKGVTNLLPLGLLNIIKEDEIKISSHLKSAAVIRNWKRQAVMALIIVLVLSGSYMRFISIKNTISYYFIEAARYKSARTSERLSKIGNSLMIYYSLIGKLPPNLHTLAEKDYIRNEESVDTWGRPFIYEVHDNSFTLFSNGQVENNRTDIIYFKGFPVNDTPI